MPAMARTLASASRCVATGNIACVTVPNIDAMISLQNGFTFPRSGSTSPDSYRFHCLSRLSSLASSLGACARIARTASA